MRQSRPSAWEAPFCLSHRDSPHLTIAREEGGGGGIAWPGRSCGRTAYLNLADGHVALPGRGCHGLGDQSRCSHPPRRRCRPRPRRSIPPPHRSHLELRCEKERPSRQAGDTPLPGFQTAAAAATYRPPAFSSWPSATAPCSPSDNPEEPRRHPSSPRPSRTASPSRPPPAQCRVCACPIRTIPRHFSTGSG